MDFAFVELSNGNCSKINNNYLKKNVVKKRVVRASCILFVLDCSIRNSLCGWQQIQTQIYFVYIIMSITCLNLVAAFVEQIFFAFEIRVNFPQRLIHAFHSLVLSFSVSCLHLFLFSCPHTFILASVITNGKLMLSHIRNSSTIRENEKDRTKNTPTIYENKVVKSANDLLTRQHTHERKEKT